MTTAQDEAYFVKVGFIRNNDETRFLGRLSLALMYAYRWLRGRFTPVLFRHVFVCSDGLCYDLTTDGIDYYYESDIVPEVWMNTVFIPIQGFEYDPVGKAYVLEAAGTHISRADIVRALLGQEVKGMFCASFVGRVLGVDVPLDIEPDSLYDLLTLLPGLTEDGIIED